jgi:uncharacterized membrane protein YoaK (UPF0700 family)
VWICHESNRWHCATAVPLNEKMRRDWTDFLNAHGLSDSARGWVAVILTWVSGYVDAAGYLQLNHIFTANMSGNTVGVGLGIAKAQGYEIVQRGWPILIFTIGMIVASVVLELGVRYEVRSRYSITMSIELLLLMSYGVWGDVSGISSLTTGQVPAGVFFGLIALAAFAMGIQNATLTSAGPLSIRTTHVTGMLAEFSQIVAAALIRHRPPHRNRSAEVVTISIWTAFALGASAGAYATSRWGLQCVFVPCAVLASLVFLDLQHPIAPSEREVPTL